jgi:serine/threonine-protein kinase
VSGSAVPVIPQLVTKIAGSANFALAGNGTLAYVPAAVATSTRNTLTRFTFDPGPESYPVWTPDGRRVIFGSAQDGGEPNLFWQAADGSGTAQRLTTRSPNPQQAFAVSPDGSRVIFREGGVSYDLHVLLLGRDRQSARLFETPFTELNAEISPDGRWLAYESDESGQHQVYVRPFPDVAGGRWLISTEGGPRPLWARNGEELFYLAGDGNEASLMTVRVQKGATWTASAPTKLFSGRFFYVDVQGQQGQGRTYDVTRDGQRFLMIREGSTDAAAAKIIVVQNWTEELKRLLPVN